MYASREGGKTHPRVLYWFRTPPNVRVGRAAFDEEAIRGLEERHPDLTFDWTHILKPGPPPEPSAAPRPGRERRRSQGPRVPAPREEPATQAPPEAREEAREAEAPPAAAEPGFSEWADEEGQAAEPPPPAAHHVEARIGREGLDRLRARYAALLARMTERITDPARLDELRAQAERLNPDTWVTEEEARHGIEQFDALYETLRAPLGRRRRRRRGGARHRRGHGRQDAQASVQAAPGADSKDPRQSD